MDKLIKNIGLNIKREINKDLFEFTINLIDDIKIYELNNNYVTKRLIGLVEKENSSYIVDISYNEKFCHIYNIVDIINVAQIHYTTKNNIIKFFNKYTRKIEFFYIDKDLTNVSIGLKFYAENYEPKEF